MGMIPPNGMESPRDQRLRARVLADPRIRDLRGELERFLTQSRALRHEPGPLLDLQGEMAASLYGFQESKRQFDTEVRTSGDGNSQEIMSAEVSSGLSKLFVRCVRDIADGIAWRTLGYDRACIKLLALKAQTGYLDWASFVGELVIAAAHVEAGHGIVVVNDLTHFLRYGDVTVVNQDYIEIVEVKAGRGSAQSGKAVRQRRALTAVIERLNREEWTTEEGIGRIHRLQSRPVSHIHELGELIAQAKNQGAAYARLSDCVAVDVWYMPVLTEIAKADEPNSFLHNPFSQSSEAGTHTRITYFEKFSINLAPYSVYPLKDEDCVDLMTGTATVWVHFNHGNLRRSLRRRGMLVGTPTDDEMESYARLTMPEKERRKDDVAIRVARPGGPNEMLIELGSLGRIIFELLDEESFADGIVELLDQSRDITEPVLYLDAFRDEAELWD